MFGTIFLSVIFRKCSISSSLGDSECVFEKMQSSFVALNVFGKWHWNLERMMIIFKYGWSEYDELSLKCGIKLEVHNLEFLL